MCAGGQISQSVLLLFVPVAGNIAIFGDSSDRSDDIDFLYHRQLEKAFSCRSNQSDRITFFIDGTGAVANRPGSLCIFDFKKLLENHFNWGHDFPGHRCTIMIGESNLEILYQYQAGTNTVF